MTKLPCHILVLSPAHPNYRYNGWSRWWSPSQEPHEVKERLQDLQEKTHPLRRDLPTMVCPTKNNTTSDQQGKSNRDISSRNCTKHNCRCDYQDVAAARGSPPASRRGPDLLMSPEIEREIENWHRTGLTPYPELAGCPPSGWSGLSRTELRLVHHIIGLSIDLHRRGLSSCTVWAQMLPR